MQYGFNLRRRRMHFQDSKGAERSTYIYFIILQD